MPIGFKGEPPQTTAGRPSLTPDPPIPVNPDLARRQAEIERQRIREAERNPLAVFRRIRRRVGDAIGTDPGPSLTIAPPDLPRPLDYPPGVVPSQGIQQDIAIGRARARVGLPVIKDVVEFATEYGPTGLRFLDAPAYVFTTPTQLGSNDIYDPPSAPAGPTSVPPAALSGDPFQWRDP